MRWHTGVHMPDHLIPAASRGAVTPPGWGAPRGGPRRGDSDAKQTLSSHVPIYMHEMLSKDLPAPGVPLIGVFLISES